MRAGSPIERDGLGVALGFHLVAYSVAFGCFALGLYTVMQPQRLPNPGLAAYKPPPATVIDVVGPLLSLPTQAVEVASIDLAPPLPAAPVATAAAVPELQPPSPAPVQAARPKRQRPVVPVNQYRGALNDYAAYPGHNSDRLH
jgi:hypothetical protein